MSSYRNSLLEEVAAPTSDTEAESETHPQYIEEKTDNEKLEKDIPILKEVVEASWRKEPELKALKDDLLQLDREIQLSLKPIEESEGVAPNAPDTASPNQQSQSQGKSEIPLVRDAPLPNTLHGVKERLWERD